MNDVDRAIEKKLNFITPNHAILAPVTHENASFAPLPHGEALTTSDGEDTSAEIAEAIEALERTAANTPRPEPHYSN